MYQAKQKIIVARIAKFVNIIFNYIYTAFIWVATLIITSVTLAVDKMSGKLSKWKSLKGSISIKR